MRARVCSHIELVRSAVGTKQAGRGLCFSGGIRLTLTTERQAAVSNERGEGSWKLEDTRFSWNRHVMEPVTRNAPPFPRECPDVGGVEVRAHGFVLAVIQGFVQELTDSEFSQRVTGKLTLVARRSVRRLGTRSWRRGADLQVILRVYASRTCIC